MYTVFIVFHISLKESFFHINEFFTRGLCWKKVAMTFTDYPPKQLSYNFAIFYPVSVSKIKFIHSVILSILAHLAYLAQSYFSLIFSAINK